MKEENDLVLQSEKMRMNVIDSRRQDKETACHCVMAAAAATTTVMMTATMRLKRHDNGDGEMMRGVKEGSLRVVY